ncbi:hypothetical protein [Corynebacterium otitidis]
MSAFEEPTDGAVHEAARRTSAPLSDFMVRLVAEELPLLDSASRGVVYRALREHAEAGGETIARQEDLPAVVRELLDLP